MRHDHDENFNLLDDDVQAAPLPTNQAELDAWIRRQELEAAASQPQADHPEAVAAPQPLPGNAPVEADDINDLLADLVLDPASIQIDDELAPSQDESEAVAAPKPSPGSDLVYRRYAQYPDADNLTDDEPADKLERKRRKDAARAKEYRDRKRSQRDVDVEKEIERLDAIPTPPIGRDARESYDKRLAALVGAAHARDARQSLVQIRGSEEEITTAWVTRTSFDGMKASISKIAKGYPGRMTKSRMQRLLIIVGQLEQPGGPWHGL
jgi:hypothetical protein